MLILAGDYIVAIQYIHNLVIVSAVMPMTKCYLQNLKVYILVLVALALRWLVFLLMSDILCFIFRSSVIALIYAVGIKHGARTSCMDRMVSF